MRVEQNSCFLLDIISQIKTQKLAQAPFNRNFAWTEKDVIMLFESIQKGYPIGNIITWTPDAPKTYNKRLGPFFFDHAPRSYIIDGHNRLATLAYSFTSSDDIDDVINLMTENEENVWGQDKTLVFNGLTQKIYFLDNSEMENTKNIIPVGYLASSQFNAYVRKNYHNMDNDFVLENMDSLGYKIRETKLINVSLERATEEQAIDAFIHMAKMGQPMTEADINKAKTWFLNQSINKQNGSEKSYNM